jgi:hypothetical protein
MLLDGSGVADEQVHEHGAKEPLHQRVGVAKLHGETQRGFAASLRLHRISRKTKRYRIQISRAETRVMPTVDEGQDVVLCAAVDLDTLLAMR